MVGVDFERAQAVGKALSKIRNNLPKDGFTNNHFYPPINASREEVAMYFLVMVALDHRMSRPRRPYEGYVKGEFFHGADLLYRIGKLLFDEKREFFTADYLEELTAEEFKELFTVRSEDGRTVSPPDPQVRASLLRDIGVKLNSLYGGSAYKLVVESRGRLIHGVADGFIDRVKVFKAYQDPVEKKPFLLAKFLERRGVLPIYDPWNKEVPVDNHLTRIAIRLGIVRVDDEVLEKIASQTTFAPEEDIVLRYMVRVAYKIVSQSSGIDPFILDDFLWMFGRKCCTRENPVCRSGCRDSCSKISGCDSGRNCVLEDVCLAKRNPLYMVNEHMFTDTWWY